MANSKIRDFLADKNVVILEPKHSSRMMIEKCMIQLGANEKNIFVFKSYKKAQEAIDKYRPEVIITEFQIFDNFGLDFISQQLSYTRNPLEKMFFILTANATDTAVADAAEESVDGYLIKPFDDKTFTKYMSNAILAKVEPSEYAMAIIKAKSLIEEKKYDDAVQSLMLAKFLHEKPLLAHFYCGLALEKKGSLDEALDEYQQGLKINNLHFKCSVGEFMILKLQNKKEKAYSVLDRVSAKFPLTPMLLKNAFILAITTYRFQEVEKFYARYIDIPRKPEDLKFVVSQALITSAKILLEDKQVPQALDYFVKGAVISGRKLKFLHNIIDTLLSHDMAEESYQFLNMLEGEGLKEEIYKPLKFKIDAFMTSESETIIRDGTKLIRDGWADSESFLIIIEHAKRIKNLKLMENLSYQALERFPEDKEKFSTYIKAA